MKIFNIRDYGAEFSDQLQTKAIQNAIDDCFLAGGGRVVIPCGVYLTGGLRIRSNVELYLEAGAILKGVRNPKEYFGYREDKLEPVTIDTTTTRPSANPTSAWSNGLIRMLDAENVSVIGEKGSYIDGCNCYDPDGEQKYRGPHGMSIHRCKNIHLEGYTFINSSNWCHCICKCENITIRNVSIYGGFDAVNIHCCEHVLVEDCTFNVGDDCIAGINAHDVVVRNSVLNTACMPVRIGGTDILVENCVSDERRFGSRRWMTDEEKFLGELTSERDRHESHTAFSFYCDHRWGELKNAPGSNIVIRNCRFEQEHELIRVEFDTRHRFCCNRGLHDLRLENCVIRDLIDTGMIWGKEDERLALCHFKNVTIACRPGHEDVPMLVAGNFDKIIFEDCTIEGYNDPTILVGTDDAQNIEVINSTPITIKRVTPEECIAAHPGGIHSGDRDNPNLYFV